MIVYVHSHDVYDSGRTFGRHRGLSDVAHIVVPAGACMGHVANTIIRTARNRRSIWLLLFNSHGNVAHVGIGTGLNARTVYDLAPVQPFMTPGGRGVEIHACLVARSGIARNPNGGPMHAEPRPYGAEFLMRMANVLNSTVRASRSLQVGYESTLGIPRPGSDDYGRFEGDMVMVQPNGAASSHAPGI